MEGVEEFKDYHHRKITTTSREAQIYCDRALIQMYGVCYGEAIRLFKKALELDENIPFALWGISYSYGPGINYNNLSEEYYKNGYEAYLKALNKIQFANEFEKDLINSLEFRYPKNFPKTFQEKLEVIKNYRQEFKKIYEKYPEDLDIVSFYIESIITIHRSMLWNLDKSPTPEVLEAKEILEKALKLGYHPHICHLQIHCLEHHPVYYKDALTSAELLAKNISEIGHLLHMPSHIYILYGRYQDCIEQGRKSVESQKKLNIGKYTLYTGNILHDTLYVVYSAMFAGQYETAITYANIIKTEIDETLIEMFFPYIEWYFSTNFHVYIRFGKWDEILSEEIIEWEKFPITRTVQRYARTIAYAVKGEIEKAELEFNLFKKEKDNISKSTLIGNNNADSVLQVAYEMALGELLYRKQDFDAAFNHLRESVKLCDKLKFSEPWDWMQPPRHALGALLLEQNFIEESIKVYKEDLNIFPDNIWSLVGLEECYTKLRDKNRDINTEEFEKCLSELNHLQDKLLKAKQQASGSTIKVSCYCKQII
jgi:tetratricopeptide (TPR) repeat protein